MIWERKTRHTESRETQAGNGAVEEKILMSEGEAVVTLDAPRAMELENPIFRNESTAALLPATYQSQTALGRSVVLTGELSGNEDFLIEGEFEGNIKLRDCCLIVGPYGRVKAEIQASQVIVFGSVDGKITARERIDLRKTSHVVGDLISAVVAMEEGAYMKGTIEVLREDANAETARSLSSGGGAILAKAAFST